MTGELDMAVNFNRISDPIRLAQAISLVPYVAGRGDWGGADCWGVVELWYWNRFSERLCDRGSIAPGPAGLRDGYRAAMGSRWAEVHQVQQDDVVIMRQRLRNGVILEHGHCGIAVGDGRLLHASERAGVRLVNLNDADIRIRISSIGRLRKLAGGAEVST